MASRGREAGVAGGYREAAGLRAKAEADEAEADEAEADEAAEEARERVEQALHLVDGAVLALGRA